jgi:hypothetical protein
LVFFAFLSKQKKRPFDGLFFDSCFFRPDFFPRVQGLSFRVSGGFLASSLFLFFA